MVSVRCLWGRCEAMHSQHYSQMSLEAEQFTEKLISAAEALLPLSQIYDVNRSSTREALQPPAAHQVAAWLLGRLVKSGALYSPELTWWHSCVSRCSSDWERESKSLLEKTCVWSSEVRNRTNLCSFLFYLFSFLWGKENERRPHSLNVELNKQWLFGCKTQSTLVFHWLYVQDILLLTVETTVWSNSLKIKASHKPVSLMQNLKLILKDPDEIWSFVP